MRLFFRTISGWGYFALVLAGISAFTKDELLHKLAVQTQQKLNAFHAAEPASMKIKKCEITVSDEGFLRYRRFYTSGKQEYYSLNLSRIRSVDYFGNSTSGSLIIHTLEDDVIVQTYNDRAGNVDSMSVQLKLTLSGIEAEDLSRVEQDLFEMKRLLRTEN